MFRACLICLLATSFLLYEFVLQVSPSVMMQELMQYFGLSTAGLGAMVAFYYYAYTAMQLPAGLLLDRFGPRRLLTFATLACAVGALGFAAVSHPGLAAIGRLMMGLGSAFAFIGALVLVARWFPPHYFAVLTGLVQFSASIGAIAGQIPLTAAVLRWGWQDTLWYLGLFGLLLAGLIYLIVRDVPPGVKINQYPGSTSFMREYRALREILGNVQTWWVGLYSFAVWAPVIAFAALWGIPFLETAYALSTATASTACAMIWLGIGLGSPLLGWWSDKIEQRCLPLTLSAFLGIVSLALIIYYPLSLFWLYINLFIMGLGATGQALAFGLVKDNNRPGIAGTAIGFNNMAVVAGGALFQPLIGYLLKSSGTHAIHSVVTYRKALLALPVCYIIAIIISHFFLRETHCKSAY
jgi:MFS family permease